MRKQGFAAVTLPGYLFVQHVHSGSIYPSSHMVHYFLEHLMTPQLQRLRQKDDHAWLRTNFEAGCRGPRVWILIIPVFWGTRLRRWVRCYRRFKGTSHLHWPWGLDNGGDRFLRNVGNHLPSNAAPHFRRPVPSTSKYQTGVTEDKHKNILAGLR
jgi:hypothetical protein